MKQRNQHYFAFVFMARLTHNDANNAGFADLPVYTLLSKLFHNNLLDNTIMVLFSDHGIRFGKMRETISGRIEERLPFVYIHLPNSSLNEFRHKNLIINAHRLTTPFDLHATLKHIIAGKLNLITINIKLNLINIKLNLCQFERISTIKSSSWHFTV